MLHASRLTIRVLDFEFRVSGLELELQYSDFILHPLTFKLHPSCKHHAWSVVPPSLFTAGGTRGGEAARHACAGRGRDARAELVRHVDHAHPLHVFVRVHPLDEAFLRVVAPGDDRTGAWMDGCMQSMDRGRTSSVGVRALGSGRSAWAYAGVDGGVSAHGRCGVRVWIVGIVCGVQAEVRREAYRRGDMAFRR